jgi:hypothetical protein
VKHLLTVLVLSVSVSAFSQNIKPQQSNDIFTLQNGNVKMDIDRSFGARIKSLKINDNEFFYQNCDYISAYTTCGSTLWPSPESLWGYPPPVELDHLAYTGGMNDSSVILRSSTSTNSNFHLQFKKAFYADSTDTSFTMIYTIINKGTDGSFSPWEVSRVPVGGMLFFPAGTTGITGSTELAARFEEQSGIQYYKYSVDDPEGKKIYSDGKDGWMVFVDDNNQLIIKKFVDVAPANFAPNEKEIELWYNDKNSYFELENQGAYTSIPSGDSSSWTMKWYFRKLPAGIDATVGNSKLIDYVKNILAGPANSVQTDKVITGSKISVFPNPSKGELVIKSTLGNKKLNLELTDLSGRMISNMMVNNDEKISLSSYENGIYIYKVLCDGKLYKTGKLVLAK